MDRDEEFRKQAADAQKMADRAGGETDKESWLRIAQGWLSLIRKPKQSEQQDFDDQVTARGTKQQDSEGSH